MAGTQKLKVGGTTVTLSPMRGYHRPDFHNRVINTAMDGTLYISDFGSKRHEEIPCALSTTDGKQINTWWSAMNTIIFFYDFDASASASVNTRILNPIQPMEKWFDTNWDTATSKYRGTIILREVG